MKPLNILVIDDEFFICEVLSDMLKRKGHTTITTTDSHEALELFEKQEYDLVLTDYRMPHLNGVELTRRMKAHKPTVPICLISGSTDEIHSEDLAIFAAVINKLFADDNLTAAIDRVLKLPSTAVDHET